MVIMRIKILILVFWLAMVCLTCSGRDDKNEELVLNQVTWIDSAFRHPALDFFIAHNLKSPAYAEIPTPDSSVKLILLRGKVPYASKYAVRSVLFYPSNNIFNNEAITRVGSSGYLQDTLELKLDENSDEITQLFIQSDTAALQLAYQWLSTSRIKPRDLPGLVVGQNLPELTLRTLAGNLITLNDYRGRLVVLNWWGTWCKPCVAEIPGLNQLRDTYIDSSVVFIAVNNEPMETIERFLKENPFKYLHSTTDSVGAQLLGEAFPRHLILDKTGRVLWSSVGGSKNTYQRLARELSKILRDAKTVEDPNGQKIS